MRRLLPVLALSSAALLALAVQSGQSGDEVRGVDSATAVAFFAPGDEKPATQKARVRLPNYYGRLGLTDEQRNRIYAVQADYGKRIDELEAQLAALRAERDQQCQAVLTAEQKQKLTELLKEQEKRRAARTKSPQPAKPAAQK